MRWQMTHTPVTVVPKPPMDLVRRVTGPLETWNLFQAPALDGERVFVLAGSTEVVLGGAIGWLYGGWCEVDTLWLEPSARGRGLGARVLATLEDEARRRGCHGMHTDTFSFQALPFYQAQGYEIFGQLDGFTDGNTRYYLRKEL